MKTFVYKLRKLNPYAEITIDYYGVVYLEHYGANGKLHNADGPAWEEWNTDGVLIHQEYWENGKLIKDGHL